MKIKALAFVITLFIAGVCIQNLRLRNLRESTLIWGAHLNFLTSAVQAFHGEKSRFPTSWSELNNYGATYWPEEFSSEGQINHWVQEGKLKIDSQGEDFIVTADVGGHVTQMRFSKDGARSSVNTSKSVMRSQ